MNRRSIGVLVLSLLFVFCGKAEAQKIVFTPQWTAQAQFAGYYVALEKGFYRDAGIEVEIVHPTLTQSALNHIRSGESQATTLQLCEAMVIIDSGVPLVNILQTSMNNAMVIVSRKDESPIRQKGIRVGTWSAGFDQMAVCLSSIEGLDYKWIPIRSGINLFLSGALDATLTMSYNELYQLMEAGVSITENNIYRLADSYNVQEDGVYMTLDYYERHQDQAERFAQASRRGWEWAADHPEETLEIVMDYVQKNHIATNRVLQKLMLEEILRQQVDRDSGQREFRLRPDMVEMANDMMLRNQLILRKITYDELIDRHTR